MFYERNDFSMIEKIASWLIGILSLALLLFTLLNSNIFAITLILLIILAILLPEKYVDEIIDKIMIVLKKITDILDKILSLIIVEIKL